MQLSDPKSLFVTFRTFTNPTDAESISYLLLSSKIEIKVKDDTGLADFTKPFNVLTGAYRLKLKPEDFPIAEKIIAAYYQPQISQADPGYFLFSFDKDELLDVALKADEWGDYNVLLAKSILADRGIVIPEEVAQNIRKQRIEELSQPEKEFGDFWLIIGYIFVILGGILGIMLGSYLASAKKTLPNGEQVYVYNKRDRRHGRIIFTSGFIMIIVWVFLRFGTAYFSFR